MFRIQQTLSGWRVERTRDGEVLAEIPALVAITAGAAPTRLSRYAFGVAYARAVELVSGLLSAVTADGSIDGLLPESWMSPPDGGVAFSELTGDGRNFVDCEWSWRDPAVGIVPLMLQTTSEWGHMGAELSGFAESLSQAGGTVGARGRLYDTEIGEQHRTLMLDGRTFGVSVDPGACTATEDCLEIGDDGWCSEWQLNFLTYQIIGMTGTPFPGFARAATMLDPATLISPEGEIEGEVPGTMPMAVAASAHSCGCATETCSCAQGAHAPARVAVLTASVASPHVEIQGTPPRRYFDDPEFVMPTPLTITNEGRVLAHVAIDGTCHTGYPETCLTPPSGCDFADFLQGRVLTEEGEYVTTGVLTWCMDHPSHDLSFHEAMSLYGDSRCGWADVAIGYDRFGTWVSGAVRPGITDDDVRVLRALALSGDWRMTRRTGRHEVIGVLAVNYPGFPITAAAGGRSIAVGRRFESPEVITAAGMVPPSLANVDAQHRLADRLEQVERVLGQPARDRLHAAQRERAVARLRA